MNTSLAFVELSVVDWSATVAWYVDVLGMTVLLRDGQRFALLGSGTARLALKADAERSTGVLLAFAVAKLDAVLVELAERGIALDEQPKDSPEGYRRVLIRDPEGRRVSLFQMPSAKAPVGGGMV